MLPEEVTSFGFFVQQHSASTTIASFERYSDHMNTHCGLFRLLKKRGILS